MRPSGAGLGNMSGQECTFSFMYTGQLPPGQVPLRTTSPRTSSPLDKFPPGGTCPGGSCPGGTCLLAGLQMIRAAILLRSLV